MPDIAQLGFRVDTSGILKAEKELDRLDKAGKDVEKTGGLVNRSMREASGGMGELGTSTGLVSRTFNELRGVVAGVGLATLATNVIQAADAYKSLQAQLGIVTDSQAELAATSETLNRIANETRSSLEGTYKLYTASLPSLQQMGFAQNEVARATELVSKAMKVAGGTAQEHAAATLQLVQAMGSGVLRGEEFNSIMENGRGLAMQLAAGLDVPIGALRGMAEQGELTADVVVNALLRQGQVIDQQFASLPVTSGQAWQQVKNDAVIAIGEIDAALDFSGAAASLIQGLGAAFTAFTGLLVSHVVPVLLEVGEHISNLADWLGDLWAAIQGSSAFQQLAGWASDLATQLGPLAEYVDEFVLAFMAFSAVGPVLALAGAAVGALGAAVGLLTSPIAIMAALAVAAVEVYRNWDTYLPLAQAAAKRLTDYWNTTTWEQKVLDVKTEALEIAQRVSDAFVAFWNGFTLTGQVLPITSDPVEVATELAEALFTWWNTTTWDQKLLDISAVPLTIAQGIFDALVESWQQSRLNELLLEVDSGPVSDAYAVVVDFVDDVSDKWDSLSQTIADSDLAAAAVRVFGDVYDAVVAMVNDIVSAFGPMVDDIAMVWDGLVDVAAGLTAELLEVFDALYPMLKVAFENGWEVLTGVVEVAWDAITAAVSLGWNALMGVLEAFFLALRGDFEGAWDAVVDTAVEFGTDLISELKAIIPKMLQVGGDIIDGLKEGITSTAAEAWGAIKGVATGVVDTFKDEVDSHSPSRVMMRVGEDVVLGLSIGITQGKDGAIRAVIEITDGVIKEVEDAAVPARVAGEAIPEGVAEGIEKNTKVVIDAADGMMDEAVDLFYARQEEIERNWQQMQIEMATVIRNSDDIKDAFDNLADWAADWLMDLSEHFSNNPLTLKLQKAGFSQQAIQAGAAGLAYGYREYQSGDGDLGTAATTGIGAGIGSIWGPLGAAIGAELGKVVGGLFDGEDKPQYEYHAQYTTAGGLQGDTDYRVGFGGREVDVDGQLMGPIGAQLNEYFASLEDQIISTFSVLGQAGAESLLEGFESVELHSDNAEEIAAWVEQTTLEAYRYAWGNLSPQLQEAVANGLDPMTASVEEWSDRLNQVAQTAATVVPIFEALGVAFEGGADGAVLGAQKFVDAMGGIENAMGFLNLYLENSLSPMEKLNFQLTMFDNAIVKSYETLGLNADAARMSSEAIGDHIMAMIQSGTATDEQIRTWTALYQQTLAHEKALDQLEQAYTSTSATMLQFGVAIDATSASGQAAIATWIDMAGGLDQFQQKAASVYDWLFTEEEKKANQLADSAMKVAEFNAGISQTTMELAGITDGYIDTKEEARQYLDYIKETSPEAYGAAVIALADVQDAMMYLQEAGMSVEEALASLPEETRRIYAEQYGYAVTATGELVQLVTDGIGLTAEAAAGVIPALMDTASNLTQLGDSAGAVEVLGVIEQLNQMTDAGMSMEQAIMSLPEDMRAIALEALGLRIENGKVVESYAAQAAAMGLTADAGASLMMQLEFARLQMLAAGDAAGAMEMEAITTQLKELTAAGIPLEEAILMLPPAMRETALAMLGYVTDGMGNIVAAVDEGMTLTAEKANELGPILATTAQEMMAVGDVAGAMELMELARELETLKDSGLTTQEAIMALPPALRDTALSMLGYVTDGMGNIVAAVDDGMSQAGEAATQGMAETAEEAIAVNNRYAEGIKEGSVIIDESALAVRTSFEAMGTTFVGGAEAIVGSTDLMLQTFQNMTDGILLATMGLEQNLEHLTEGFQTVSTLFAQGSITVQEFGITFNALLLGLNDALLIAMETFSAMTEGVLTGNELITASYISLIETITSIVEQVTVSNTALVESFDTLHAGMTLAANEIYLAATSLAETLNALILTFRGAAEGIGAETILMQGSFDLLALAIFESRLGIELDAQLLGDTLTALAEVIGTSVVAIVASTGEITLALETTATNFTTTAGTISLAANDTNISLVAIGDTLITQSGVIATETQAVNDSLTGMTTMMNTSAGLVDTEAGNMETSVSDLATAMGGSAGDINDATTTANGALSGFSDAIKAVAKAASDAAGIASRAAAGALKSEQDAGLSSRLADSFRKAAEDNAAASKSSADSASGFRDAAQSIQGSLSSLIDGSHAMGLAEVPFDGYVAELHKGEMVVPANDAAYLRGEKTSADPALFRGSREDAQAKELKAVNEKLERLIKDTRTAANANVGALKGIANETRTQTETLRNVDRSNDRISRKLSQ